MTVTSRAAQRLGVVEHVDQKHDGRLPGMAPLVPTDDVVEALELYDGDVIEHPGTGAIMTITAHMHLDPHRLDLVPGVVRFDIYDNLDVDGPLEWHGPEEQLVIGPGLRVRRLYQYVLPPGARIG